MIKKLASLTLILSVALVLGMVGFSQPVEAETTRVGIVFSTGGLGDMSFNDLAYDGLTRAQENYDMEFDYVEPDDVADFDPSLRRFARGGYDLVFGTGFQMVDDMQEVAPVFPDVSFGFIDHSFDPTIDNVQGLTFAEHEGSFLVGALAALVTENDNVGFIGGVDGPLINRFEGGFVQGVEYIAEETGRDIEIQSSYADSFNDSARGREIALGFVDNGADVIYHAAGGTGEGLFTAAEEEDIFAIGVDDNQNWISPGRIIASMLKRVDVAVYETVQDYIEGNFEGDRNVAFGIEDGGIDITTLEAEVDELVKERLRERDREEDIEKIREMKEEVTAPHADRIEEIKQLIVEGEIEIEDWSVTGRQEF